MMDRGGYSIFKRKIVRFEEDDGIQVDKAAV